MSYYCELLFVGAAGSGELWAWGAGGANRRSLSFIAIAHAPSCEIAVVALLFGGGSQPRDASAAPPCTLSVAGSLIHHTVDERFAGLISHTNLTA